MADRECTAHIKIVKIPNVTANHLLGKTNLIVIVTCDIIDVTL